MEHEEAKVSSRGRVPEVRKALLASRHTPAYAPDWVTACGISVRTHQMCSGWENLTCGCARSPSCRNNVVAECTALGQTAVDREDWAEEPRIPPFKNAHRCCCQGSSACLGTYTAMPPNPEEPNKRLVELKWLFLLDVCPESDI